MEAQRRFLAWVHSVATSRFFVPRRAYNVGFHKVSNSCWSVTFCYQGRRFRGHAALPAMLASYPWYGKARMTLKRPVAATDEEGKDVLSRMQEYWGPTGNWNKEVGLAFVGGSDPEIAGHVEVRFNDGSTATV